MLVVVLVYILIYFLFIFYIIHSYLLSQFLSVFSYFKDIDLDITFNPVLSEKDKLHQDFYGDIKTLKKILFLIY
jgi:hypothetical protein